MKVQWTDVALIEFQAAVDFIDTHNPTAADRLSQRLVDAALSLSTFPRRGREVQPGIHQLSIIYPYLIRYRISGGTVEILSVRHGARHETD